MEIRDCWIQPEIDAFDPKKEQPASYVRRVFVLQKPVRRAELCMTALGVYRGFLNGEALDVQLLTPG